MLIFALTLVSIIILFGWVFYKVKKYQIGTQIARNGYAVDELLREAIKVGERSRTIAPKSLDTVEKELSFMFGVIDAYIEAAIGRISDADLSRVIEFNESRESYIHRVSNASRIYMLSLMEGRGKNPNAIRIFVNGEFRTGYLSKFYNQGKGSKL